MKKEFVDSLYKETLWIKSLIEISPSVTYDQYFNSNAAYSLVLSKANTRDYVGFSLSLF